MFMAGIQASITSIALILVHAPHRQHPNHVQSLTRSEASFGTVGKDFRNFAGFELALHAAPEIRAKQIAVMLE